MGISVKDGLRIIDVLRNWASQKLHSCSYSAWRHACRHRRPHRRMVNWRGALVLGIWEPKLEGCNDSSARPGQGCVLKCVGMSCEQADAASCRQLGRRFRAMFSMSLGGLLDLCC